MLIHEAIDRFRLAARELRNNFFSLEGPSPDWDLLVRFRAVESALFDAIVALPFDLEPRQYGSGKPIKGIRVVPRTAVLPAMVNRTRGASHGYWDHPVREIPPGAAIEFYSFFDWDQTGTQDYHLAQIVIGEHSGDPDISGHHALAEYQYVRFEGPNPDVAQ